MIIYLGYFCHVNFSQFCNSHWGQKHLTERNRSRKLLLHSQKWSYGLSKYQTCVGTHTLPRNVRQETLKIKTAVTVFINYE